MGCYPGPYSCCLPAATLQASSNLLSTPPSSHFLIWEWQRGSAQNQDHCSSFQSHLSRRKLIETVLSVARCQRRASTMMPAICGSLRSSARSFGMYPGNPLKCHEPRETKDRYQNVRLTATRSTGKSMEPAMTSADSSSHRRSNESRI